ncbi:MAG: phosphoribosylformylglycinamidine synthase [Patescibacteria group bacterium]|nr:phosphoribosylformylglycinamidine synthase [Patescibacteria group bacterium]
MLLTKLFRANALTASQAAQIASDASDRLGLKIGRVEAEWCFYIEHKEPFDGRELVTLDWLLSETFDRQGFCDTSRISAKTVLEVGPRLNFETPFSSTAVAICHKCGLYKVTRLERSIRYGLDVNLDGEQGDKFLEPLHDRMVQMRYYEPLISFGDVRKPEPIRVIDVMTDNWRETLRTYGKQNGCGWDEQDLDFLGRLFRDDLKRNPTDVELFQLAQANSEHSRHGFFKGRHVIDGRPEVMTLMDLVKQPLREAPSNSLIAFCDDSSAIRGHKVRALELSDPCEHSPFILTVRLRHPTLTAETHNHPTRICPQPGAETGIGGDIRDAEAIGRGGLCGMHGAGYSVGALKIPGYELPWEINAWPHASDGASPLRILIEGCRGVHAYGNCFGEPTTFGFVRSTAITLPNAEHYAYQKPILYVTAAGTVDDEHTQKREPEKGMLVVQIGGPAYRIGMGGGSASSMSGGQNTGSLDFNSVQRGDAQMEQRHYRVIQACVAMGEKNPIVSVHDLGAGGDCNALPEIVHPAGGRIYLSAIPSGDPSLSKLEIWGNESQERMVLLIKSEDLDIILQIAEREGVTCEVVGSVTGDGQLVVFDSRDDSTPVNLPLEKILGKLPPKSFEDKHVPVATKPLELPEGLTVLEALVRVSRLPSVGSKQFLTRNVDRSVRGLTPQQQCVGPNHLPLSDYAVRADGYFDSTGAAHSLGERPMIGLINPGAMARMTVAEALLNMVGARIINLNTIKGSANWMLAAKLTGQGAWLFDAMKSLTKFCIDLGIAVDGGKDSLSMSVKTTDLEGKSATVKSPSTLVFSAYAPMGDVTMKVTPDLKKAGNALILVDLAPGKHRLGGSALAQVHNQVGEETPDVDDPQLVRTAFQAIQRLIAEGRIASIHDRSEGGLIVTLLEMAFGGNKGFRAYVNENDDALACLFCEELGAVIECEDRMSVLETLWDAGVQAQCLGSVISDNKVVVDFCGRIVLKESMTDMRAIWERTSDALEMLQANPECVRSEQLVCHHLLTPPPYLATFKPQPTPEELLKAEHKPRVAIIREQGSNGDREMAAAFYTAGFDPWDVTMTDLLEGRVSLDDFRGIAFVGGFSYADVFDAGKGWAGVIRYNERVSQQLERFRRRADTFSLGVCNGCQLMALLGWVPGFDLMALDETQQPRFIRNVSGRFESRFPAVTIGDSKAIMLKGMEGSTLGVWSAHGEGRFHANPTMTERILALDLAPFRYVDPKGQTTTSYPFNPNGSPHGIAGLCSEDGRHLAMMPHPERAFLLRQWPWIPDNWKRLAASPWLKMFQNAYDWCMR